jgi:hypothetical protein
MTTRDERNPYLALIRERYHVLEARAQERDEEGQERHEVVIIYHSPAGAVIEVVGDIFADKDSEALLIEGKDRQGNYCEAVAHQQSASFVLKLLPIPPEAAPKPKPGFVR